ncbi:CopG family ribbon-helix-helix protein [Tepidicaulis sp. LMO-SS28]|uniref:CopG family ribbon-helix-helix protein n=1 Tax=Tepidicaulis sp. LMO-SS28 TaxID=3447455 RepID=UPI003EE267D1
MAKEAVFTMKLEAELREAFMAEAAAQDRPASQVLRELMRAYVERQREERDYDLWFRRKVDEGLRDVEAGRTVPHEEVMERLKARIAEAAKRAG